jgi:hypothetical protein
VRSLAVEQQQLAQAAGEGLAEKKPTTPAGRTTARNPPELLWHCVLPAAASVADPEAVGVEEPQQLVMQDDLDQLLEMLPADLGSTLINHPKRAQLIEVNVQ